MNYSRFRNRSSMLLVAMVVSFVGGEVCHAQLPSTGYVDSYAGVGLTGECVPNARSLGTSIVRRTLPLIGVNGVAADLWTVGTPGFAKVSRVLNGQVRMPPVYSFIIWSKQLGGTGHVAMVVGSVNGPQRIVRIVDTNWGSDGRGQIHDVSVNDSRILGYLVWQ